MYRRQLDIFAGDGIKLNMYSRESESVRYLSVVFHWNPSNTPGKLLLHPTYGALHSRWGFTYKRISCWNVELPHPEFTQQTSLTSILNFI